ncbi:hypothetical protein K2173_007766 [Erythroxylum novogranatense]|uniref:E3 ubiquitin-protein ligase RMA n=1 Tax=Erythroxylum novogranatense TaxID=1862640 RepID=A0AAV8TEM1_9ROSI|nr:hypothetical protein K2173_007766 [Erythroxylum novogranatense]
MAMEENFFEHDSYYDSEESTTLKQKWKSVQTHTTVSDDNNGWFDCNICLDSAHEPVVTFCGHLYCWSCIYKWLHVCSSSQDADLQQPNCPVCKASISLKSVVPLYGRGSSASESESKRAPKDVVVPRRPPPSSLSMSASNNSHQSPPSLFQPQPQPFHNQHTFPQSYGGYAAMASSNFGGTTLTNLFNPMIGMVGELMFARILGTSNPSLFAYSYPNSYFLMGRSNPRMRRQEMQLEKSLHRVTLFLLCCIIFCLLLF